MSDLSVGDRHKVGPQIGRRRAAVLAEAVVAPIARVVARDQLLGGLDAVAKPALTTLKRVVAERRRERIFTSVSAQQRVRVAQTLAGEERLVQRDVDAKRRRRSRRRRFRNGRRRRGVETASTQ